MTTEVKVQQLHGEFVHHTLTQPTFIWPQVKFFLDMCKKRNYNWENFIRRKQTLSDKLDGITTKFNQEIRKHTIQNTNTYFDGECLSVSNTHFDPGLFFYIPTLNSVRSDGGTPITFRWLPSNNNVITPDFSSVQINRWGWLVWKYRNVNYSPIIKSV